ncbi:MAG: BtaA family protein [Firmicutes bacterium]|nr:BtaA family protein [Bacillota bacterium]
MSKKRFKIEPYIRYANCYEDAGTLHAIIDESVRSVLSIASGGDNSLALLANDNIESLMVFDKNPSQLYLTKLKFSAFKHLSYEKVLILFGIEAGNPLEIYCELMPNLDSEVIKYFNERIDLIDKIKLINCGKFEYYLNKIRTNAIRFCISKKKISRFINIEINEQKKYYLNKINKFRWRFITKKFFSQKIVEKLGRDKENFAYANDDLFSKIHNRMLLCFDNVKNDENIYLQYTVYGRFIALPYYLQPQNFAKIKANIDKVEFVLGDLKTVASLQKQFDFFNLSDIFEYMSEDEARENEHLIEAVANERARVVFWNMMIDRQFKSENFEPFDEAKVQEIYEKEMAYYYQALRVYTKI